MSEKHGKLIHVKGDLYLVPLSMLKPANAAIDPSSKHVIFANPRKFSIAGKVEADGMDAEEMEKLGASIVADGQLHPLLVRPFPDAAHLDHYQIVDGERRWRRIKKAYAEKVSCRADDGTMVPADKRYEYVECRVREMSDLEAYAWASKSPGVPPNPAATAQVAKYLHDCGVTEEDILRATNNKSHRWLAETLTIMGLDEFCVQAFLKGKKGGISRNMALQYAKEKDVAKRVARCKADIARVFEERDEMVREANQHLNSALDILDMSKADALIAQHTGVGKDKAQRKVKSAEREVERREKKVKEAEDAPVQVNVRNTKKAHEGTTGGDEPPKFITKRAMEREWVLPLEQLIAAGGTDKSGQDMGVDVEDAKFVLFLWKMMTNGDTDIIAGLKRWAKKKVTA